MFSVEGDALNIHVARVACVRVGVRMRGLPMSQVESDFFDLRFSMMSDKEEMLAEKRKLKEKFDRDKANLESLLADRV